MLLRGLSWAFIVNQFEHYSQLSWQSILTCLSRLRLQRAQNNLASLPENARPLLHLLHWLPVRQRVTYWLYWLTRCGPQPLKRTSMSWYRPVHHLGLCALLMLWCSSFLACIPNWSVTLFLLLLHPPGNLYLLTFDCAKTFSLSNATWKPIYSNSLSPPVLHQAPLYLRT